MLITFEVPVVVGARPGRAVNLRSVFGFEPITVDVPEFSDAEAPVALRYSLVDNNARRCPEQFRAVEGTLYHDIKAPPSARMRVPFARSRADDGLFDTHMAAMATEIENIKKSWSTAAPRYIAPRSFEDIGKHGVMSVQLEPLASMDLKGDFEMALHIQLDAFRDIIRGLVIVDGKFHLPEAEPLLALVPVVGGDIHCRVLRAAERAAPGVLAGRGLELLSMGYYRLDEMDRLRTEATAISGDRGFREQFDDVEVLDSAICQADTDLLTLIELGATMRQYFASSLIPERDNWNDSERVSRMAETMYRLPLDQIVLFKCLVDGLEAAKLTGCGDQLEAALSTIVSSDDRSDDRRLFIHSGRIGEYAHRIMRRWEDREVKLDHGLPGTLRIGLSSI